MPEPSQTYAKPGNAVGEMDLFLRILSFGIWGRPGKAVALDD